MIVRITRRLRLASGFVLTLLAIELLDELVFGLREVAWPLIRDDLALNYIQIGLLVSAPSLVGNLVEPALGILADVWRRRVLILGGGIAFTVALLLMSTSQSFIALLIAFSLSGPASGAFVSLSQVALMDHDPTRHEHNMARWALAGSLGQTGGTLALGAFVAVGLGWRHAFAAYALLALLLVLKAWRFPFPNGTAEAGETISFWQGVKRALAALRRREVLRWLLLLEMCNLMLDVFLSYLALYMVDVARVDESQAGIAVAVWLGVGLVGDVLLIPLLERVRGLTYLRFNAAVVLLLFPAFLLAEPLLLKLVILGFLGFFNSGWYSILQGQLYTAMPGQSGAVLTLSNLAGLVGTVIPLVIGVMAEHFGLGVAIWLLWLGPIVLLVGIPRQLTQPITSGR
jgi:FSR family fosmidomycin resistance protein-like MFS transporter